MNEVEINTIFDLVTDPEKNFYDVKKYDKKCEIERIIRVFNITNEQRKTCSKISSRGLVAFKMLVSNN